MPLPAETQERHAAILGELAELGMTLARDAHARALAAKTPEEADRMANAFHRMSRGVRMTLALEARLDRDRRSVERSFRSDIEREHQDRLHRRKVALFARVNRLISDTVEDDDEQERLYDRLDERIETEAEQEDFLTAPFDDQVLRLRADLGLPAAEDEEAADDEEDDAPEQPDTPEASHEDPPPLAAWPEPPDPPRPDTG